MGRVQEMTQTYLSPLQYYQTQPLCPSLMIQTQVSLPVILSINNLPCSENVH